MTNALRRGIIGEQIAVSPSGKASDSDSDITGVRIPVPQPRLPTEIDDVGEIPDPTRVSGIFYCKNHSENKKMTFGKKVGLQGFEPLHTLIKGGLCEN